MSSNKRICKTRVYGHVAPGIAVAIAMAAGGCSADVTRFDFPFFNLTSKSSTTTTGSLPAQPEALARNSTDTYDGPSGPPRGAGLSGEAGRGYAPAPYAEDRVASRDYSASLPPARGEVLPSAERYASRPPPQERRAERPPAAGESIEVQQGDTLYGLARRHGVSVAALKDANGLQNESLKPGQRLVLPSGAAPDRAERAPVAARSPGDLPGRTQMGRPMPPPAAAQAPQAPQAPPGWEGRYTLKNGDSPYGIARQHGVSLDELMRVNGIADPTKVRAGVVLFVPGGREQAAERSPPMAAAPSSPPRVVQTQPRIINAPNAPEEPARMAKRGDIASDATEGPPDALGKFRWPVKGRIIAAFGKRPDGTHNDGINLAVPNGTDIHAAEGGRVAYSGNELKAYGNLILIRHSNGWVSAYAHADQVLVKRDDVIKRGQVIAKAGKTGSVDQPQVHFELRQGSKPVDPLPHMEKN